MTTQPSTRSAKFHCLVSLLGVVGAFIAWNLWFVAGGWQRHQHWGESILWSVSVVMGLWGAIDAVRFDRGSSWVTPTSILFGFFHMLSAMLFLLFMQGLASGGPRP
jgi:membrane protein YdbS with pleckstrin-like domain